MTAESSVFFVLSSARYEIPDTRCEFRPLSSERRATGDERRILSSVFIMQNKPNFRKAQMNITSSKTKNYEQ